MIKPATPLPWRIGSDFPLRGIMNSDTQEGVFYFQKNEKTETNAAYIVTACNEFPALVECISALLPMAEDDCFQYGDDPRADTDIINARALLTRCGVKL